MSKKLDFRNVTVTQFDSAQTQKMSFSELHSAHKHFTTSAILKRPYTHFTQILDGENRPTKVEYYEATVPARDRINVKADNNSDLAGTYITLTEFISKKTFVYYFVVSGTGSAPGIGDVEIPVEINQNDPASLVAFSLKSSFNNTEEFEVIGDQLLAAYIDIEYLEFGETPAINVGTTGFLSTRIQEGRSIKVGEVELEYDEDDNIIYNGNTLKDFTFNAYKASFDPKVGLAVVDDKKITSTNCYEKEALDVSVLHEVLWDRIETTFPSNNVDLFTYTKNNEVVQTVRVTYQNSSKNVIILVEKTRS